MKQLTQAIFSGQPSWVKSAAINGSNGIVGLFDVEAKYLDESGGYWGYHKYFPISTEFRHIKAGSGFDTKNWRHSAIDRGRHENHQRLLSSRSANCLPSERKRISRAVRQIEGGCW